MSLELMQEAVDAVAKFGTQWAAARALGIPRPTLQHRIESAQAHNIVAGGVASSADNDQLRDRLREVETQLRNIRSNTLTDEYVKRKILGLREELDTVDSPKWAITPKRDKALPGVPVTIWSDWHWGEVVNKGELGSINEFNLEIAHRRAKTLSDRTIYLLTEHVVRPQYPGIIVCLGGDLMSGDIHDELTATNEVATLPAMLDLFGVLCVMLARMADCFGKVFVPCVSGNHGRLTHKPRAKQRNFTNLDWLLYQFLRRHFESKGDWRVKFMIPDSPDARFRVWGFNYCLTHGDQFRGGDGMIGHFGPVMRGHKKKLAREASIGRDFDLMMHGHFHTYFPTGQIIGNGSLKGYDEYAAGLNLPYEPPIQALWLCHPEHGVVQHLPIYLEPHARLGGASADWYAVPQEAHG